MNSIFQEEVLRDWCYDTLKEELQNIFPEIK